MTNINQLKKIAILSLAAMLTWGADAAHGQFFLNWIEPGQANWNTDSAWDQGFPPDSSFGDAARIGNGGTAIVNTGAAASVTDVSRGTLQIETGGNFSSGGGGESGAVTIGSGGSTGNLRVLGGAFNAPKLTVGGASDSTVELSGTGSISISGNAALKRTTRIIGNSASFDVGGNLSVGGNFISEITNSNTHTAINALGDVTIQGGAALDLVFNGVTPATGASWTLFSGASSYSGNFSSLSGPALGPGLGYKVSSAGGNLSVGIGSILTLTVDRQTGAGTLASLATPVNAKLYAIGSPGGFLSPAGWTSLEDSGYDGGSWIQGTVGGNPNGLAEAHNNPPGGSSSFSADQSLGVVLDTSGLVFGGTLDLTLEYLEANATIATIGSVVYTGNHNNLVLRVDPTTGAAAIQNQSSFDVDIKLYSVASEGGSLDFDATETVGSGWDGFDEQDVDSGKWLRGDGSANLIAEAVQVGGSSTLVSAGAVFDLGTPFSDGGAQDLSFEFLLDGASQAMAGIVEYGQLPTTNPPIPADLNGDGFVDGLDLGILLGSFNTATTPSMGELNGTDPVDGLDLGILLGAWNPPPASAVSAVPEPTSIALLVLVSVSMLSVQRKRS